ncbi:MAG TPA: hypothetical protein VK974_04755 [Methylophilaceae bacterium]|nr:hypothetical protein [Methylophilaceae bacterium]
MSDNQQVDKDASYIVRSLEKTNGVDTQIIALDIGGAGAEKLLSEDNPLPSNDAAAVFALNAILAALGSTLTVDGSVLTGGLTDSELRANPIAVSSSASYAEDTAHVTGAMGNLMFGIRSDADAATADDGDYTVIKLDEKGRVKVSSMPASYADVSGNITAVQAVIGVPVAGGTVTADVSRASNVMMFCTGIFSAINCTFEGCLEATGENWFGIQAIRSNANTIETSTGSLSAAPTYAWELSVNALARVRVRATARTSGTQAWLIKLGTYATEPIPGAQLPSGTQNSLLQTGANVIGTARTGSPIVAGTSASLFKVLAGASTNAALLKTGGGLVTGYQLTNNAAYAVFVKFFATGSTPVPGTTVPIYQIQIPAGGSITLPQGYGLNHSTGGIGICITKGSAELDATAVAAGDVVGWIQYV